jgi:arginine deiminase
MKIGEIVLLIFVILGAGSCGPDHTKILEQKRAEVMKVHDDAMANHGNLNKNSRLLKGVIASAEDMAEKQEITAALKKLQEANTAMMKWMQEYKDPEPSVAFEIKMEYYEKVQKEMEDIHAQINEAMEISEPLIQKYQK